VTHHRDFVGTPGTGTAAVLLDLYDTIAHMDRDVIAAGRGRGAELAGADPHRLVEAWRASVDARSVGRMGTPQDELRHLLEECAAPGPGDGLLDELVRLEAAIWRSGVRLYDDVLPGIEAIRRSGRRLAIVSNCSWQTAGVLEATGLPGEVDAVVLSFEVGLMKPDPAILRVALERVGADPARSALVDDLAGNLDAARALGMATILMDRRGVAAAPAHPAVRDLVAAAALLGA
jgi:putative hydrolase of the HAD superfamily